MLLAVWAVHLLTVWTWFELTVLPTHTLHNNAMRQVVSSMVLTGHSRLELPTTDCAWHLPPTDEGYGAVDLVRSAMGSPFQRQQYWTTVPLFTLLSSLPAVLLGIDPLTSQVGAVVPLGLLMLAIYAVARRFTTPSTAAAAAILVTLLPATIGAMRTSYPYLGLMLGPATAVAALLATDRFRRLAWVVPAALLTTLATRWGESASDALKALFAISGVVAVLGASLLLRGTERSSRGLAGLGIYLLVVFATIDGGWLLQHARDLVVPQAAQDASTPLVLLPLDAISAFLGYVWLCQRLYLGWPAAIVIGAGAVWIVRAWKGKDVDWRIRLTAVAVWIVAPLIVLSLSEKRHADYMIGVIPPLAVVAAVGCREVRRIGPFLPWAAVLLLVPTYVALNSPGVLASDPTKRAAIVQYGMSVQTCNPVLTEDPWHGIIESPLVTFTDFQTHPTVQQQPIVDARRWACEGDGAAAFRAMPAGSVVVAVLEGYGLFDWVGAGLQACHPHVVFRTDATAQTVAAGTTTGFRASAVGERWDDVYVATFRIDTSGGAEPPVHLGDLVEVARSDEIVLYRIVQTGTQAVLLTAVSR